MDRRGFSKWFASLCLLSSGTNLWSEERWPGWRGSTRDGILSSTKLPSSLDDTSLKKMWDIPLDCSYSGPIIESDRVIVTETRTKKIEAVLALSRKDGTKLWEAEWDGAMSVPFFAKSNGDWIRSTPASDGIRIFVAGMRDVLVCLNVSDGKEVWRIDFPKVFGTPLPDFGFVCSPLIDGEYLVVHAGGSLFKLEGATGKVVWRSLEDGGGMNGSAFSSPVVAELKGVKQYVVQTRTQLYGIDPTNGKPIWSKEIEAFRGMNILTPSLWKDRIFTSSYGGKSWLFELESSQSAPWTVRTAWEQKSQGYMSTPLIIGSHIYMHLRNQRFVCIDLESGKETWTSKPFGKYWSMVASDSKILALDERGILYLIEANPNELKILSERKVSDEECWAHVALADNQIFIRHLKGLSLFEWQ